MRCETKLDRSFVPEEPLALPIIKELSLGPGGGADTALPTTSGGTSDAAFAAP